MIDLTDVLTYSPNWWVAWFLLLSIPASAVIVYAATGYLSDPPPLSVTLGTGIVGGVVIMAGFFFVPSLSERNEALNTAIEETYGVYANLVFEDRYTYNPSIDSVFAQSGTTVVNAEGKTVEYLLVYRGDNKGQLYYSDNSSTFALVPLPH